METGGGVDNWAGITEDPLMLGSAGIPVIIQSKTSTGESYSQVLGEDSYSPRDCNDLGYQCNAVQQNHRSKSREQWVLHIPFHDSPKECFSCLIMNLRPLNQLITSTKSKYDHHKAD